MKQHILIIIPPLGASSHKIGEKITKNWNRNFGITPINYQHFWQNSSASYETRLIELINTIDELSKNSTQVSLLGLSAGGSVALNAFDQRKDKISKVINVGGRLKSGTVNFPESKLKNDNNYLFKESVTLCEKNIASLSANDKAKILTIRPLWDEYAPIEFVTVEGAKNLQIVAVEHVIGILLAMTMYKKSIITFLKQNDTE